MALTEMVTDETAEIDEEGLEVELPEVEEGDETEVTEDENPNVAAQSVFSDGSTDRTQQVSGAYVDILPHHVELVGAGQHLVKFLPGNLFQPGMSNPGYKRSIASILVIEKKWFWNIYIRAVSQ